MRIHRLIVRQTFPCELIIRNIEFNHNGLNLIVDNTKLTEDEKGKKPEKSKSGNSVGKTTAIKIIDLCLGAKTIKELYYDPDTSSENDSIKEFLHYNKVQAELILINENNVYTSIKRDLFIRGKRYIDDEIYNYKEFNDKLKYLIFDTQEHYPTFRQLMPKFIRLSDSSEDGMIKFLPRMTSKATYNTVYSFLFHIIDENLISRRNDLDNQLSECIKAIDVLEKNKNISSISVLRQKEKLINDELDKYNKKRKQLSYMEQYKKELNKKRKISSKISKLQEKIQFFDFEIETINNSINKLKKDKANINLFNLRNIYQEANKYIPELHKSFKDVIQFHNTMIQNRIDFVNEQLHSKEQSQSNYLEQIDELLEQKKKLTIDILDEGLLDELNIINKQIEDFSLQKGKITQSIKLLVDQEKEKNRLIEDIKNLESKIDDNDTQDKLNKFNNIFSDYCYKLYAEKFLLGYNSLWEKQKKFPVEVSSLVGNMGTGKKKGVIVAFDLAYMKYANEMGIHCPKFVIHDKLENTHINQLKTIFEICQNIEGQYIVPILRERIDKIDDKYVNKAVVLELSENDKFLKVK